MKAFALCITLLMTGSFLYPDQVLHERLEQDRVINQIVLFNPFYFLSNPFSFVFHRDIQKPRTYFLPKAEWTSFASSGYQALGEEAQRVVGIPEGDRLPILSMRQGDVFYVPNRIGFATRYAIYVNEQFLDVTSYGFRRSVLFHEAIHAKYDGDLFAFEPFFRLGRGAMFGALMYLFTRMLQVRKSVHSSVGLFGLLFGLLVPLNYCYYKERRADLEGLYATGCWQCVHEVARITLSTGDFTTEGYLARDEVEEIAQDLKKNNMLCSYHQNEMESD